tara:strand:+ start:2412 stop:4769 length:2358 start_codon:yes stop_codon:yes gene_type:complete
MSNIPVPKFNILILNINCSSEITVCIESILKQTYINYELFIGYDDIHSLEYLKKYNSNSKITIFKLEQEDKRTPYYHNLYWNQLLSKVKNGWILFLKDIDELHTDTVLDIIRYYTYQNNKTIFWKVKEYNRILSFKDITKIKEQYFSSTNFCLHSDYKDDSYWESKPFGNYYFLKRLMNKTTMEHQFIDLVLTQTKNVNIMHNKSLKDQHRIACLEHLPLLKNIIIPEFGDVTNIKETVLIEFRELPHIEYIVRKTIIKLPNWNHTIVCGINNHEQILNICNDICKSVKSRINIIKLNISNITPSEYSKLLLQKEFWHRLLGEKLLIYQEDTLIFHSDIEPFLKYDYVGAPWPILQDDNKYGVGNGGFSLRTKQTLLECIDKVNIKNLKLGQSTLGYIKATGSDFVPEDVFFSKSMIDFSIGVVAPRYIARKFSQETQYSETPLGGHNYWLAKNPNNGNNVNNIRNNFNKIKLIDNYYTQTTHRGGWKNIIQYGIDNNIINVEKYMSTNDIILIDCMESFFYFNKETNKNFILNKWYGVMHYTNELPKFLRNYSLHSVINSCMKYLSTCKGIIVLSNYIKTQLEKYRLEIPIYVIKHPVSNTDTIFSLETFLNIEQPSLIQLGQQYRQVTSIYRIKFKGKKIWLPGGKSTAEQYNALRNEAKYLNYNINIDTVKIYNTSSYLEYDNLLINNIIIIPLWNASANNSILECIHMNIPAFVTRLPATEEYLGKEYPMFFTNISEVEYIINNKNLLHKTYTKTHNYMKMMDKSDIQVNVFYSELLKIMI